MSESITLPEAGFSLTFKMYDPAGNDVQFTMRAATAAEWLDVLTQRKHLIDKATSGGWRLFGGNPAPTQQKPATTQQRPASAQNSGAQHTFRANKLTVQFSPNGKKLGKFHGGNFQKYGITVWPEVAQELGFFFDEIQPGDELLCDLELAYTVNDEGKPQKVVGLAGGQAPAAKAAAAPASHQEQGFGMNDDPVPF